MPPMLVLDTETAGMPRDPWSGVVEIAAVVVDETGAELGAWSSLVKPRGADEMLGYFADPLPVCLISHADVLAAPGPREALAALGQLWVAHGKPRWCAYNQDFDREMLAALHGRALAVPWGPCLMRASHAAMVAAEQRGEKTGLPWLDWKKDYKWPTAEEAAAWLGVPVQTPSHRALPDVRTEAAILVALTRRGALDWPG